MTNLAIARRELQRKMGDLITIVAEAAPITALQCVVLIRGSNKVRGGAGLRLGVGRVRVGVRVGVCVRGLTELHES